MADVLFQLEDAALQTSLKKLIALGSDMTPVMKELAALGENQTRMRFRIETGPDGQRWKPSLRVQAAGGRTLVRDGHLLGSLSSRGNSDSAEWGVNRIYARIHQEGGVIRAKGAKPLRFKVGGLWRSKQSVVIPARPYLGVNDDDRAAMLDVLTRRIGEASNAR